MTLEESYLKNSRVSLKPDSFLRSDFRIFFFQLHETGTFKALDTCKLFTYLLCLPIINITKVQSVVAKLWLIFILVISLPAELQSSQEFHSVKFSIFMFSNVLEIPSPLQNVQNDLFQSVLLKLKSSVITILGSWHGDRFGTFLAECMDVLFSSVY